MKLQVSRGSEARPGRRLSVKLKVGGAAVEVQTSEADAGITSYR